MRFDFRFLSSAIVAVGLAACGGSVDDPNGGNRDGVGACGDCPDETPKQEPGPDPNGDAGAGVPVDPTPTPDPVPIPSGALQAIALRYAEFPPTVPPDDPEIDPNTLYVMIGSTSPSCLAPFAYQGCGTWKVSIGIPPDLVKPGLLELSDPRLISSFSSSGPDRGAGDCSVGAGSFIEGTIEILGLSMSGSTVEVRLADTWTFDHDVNGSYVAAFCY